MRNPKPTPEFWTYRDAKITIDHRAMFSGEVGGVSLYAGSFDGIKRKIDEAAMFDCFDAIVESYGTIKKLRITGIARNARGRKWVDDKGTEHQTIVRDTPANRKIVQAYVDFRKVEEARKNAASTKIGELREAIPWELVDPSQ